MKLRACDYCRRVRKGRLFDLVATSAPLLLRYQAYQRIVKGGCHNGRRTGNNYDSTLQPVKRSWVEVQAGFHSAVPIPANDLVLALPASHRHCCLRKSWLSIIDESHLLRLARSSSGTASLMHRYAGGSSRKKGFSVLSCQSAAFDW